MPRTHYSPETIAKACEMYAEGSHLKDIAIALKIPKRTILGWYSRKYPEDWKEKRERRVTVKSELLEEEALETYSKTKVRQQKLLRGVMIRLARRIVEAEDEHLSTGQALNHLTETMDAEKELFVDVEEVVKMKHRVPTTTIGVGASIQDKNGINAQAMAFLTEASKHVYGTAGAADTKPPEDDDG